ncbi:hypothetical protein JAAARDRAFT_62663 [Jaapia argillacea MUCL 33604]|uniref:Nephrocystin 3-like N-terminal domain-containing protein n=1 Tax=Jaapia argillacea MUCL 33604 TaxID=933084 RepID=A0A067PJR8_9AGAM|nr:hypothetical protein JAAARDRAFT_62663 [Jaapia argillacea MUCL 33604]
MAMDLKYLRDDAVRKRIGNGSDYGGWKAANRCLPDTRLEYIEQILDWSVDWEAPTICWVNGVAGCGKSTIAHEIAARLHDGDGMYSCFFFKRDDILISSSVIQILAFGLSCYSDMLKTNIAEAMKTLGDVRHTPSVVEQLELFVIAPLITFSATNPRKPITLIIDALDECPGGLREEVTRAIRMGAPLLPKNVKILLTSRPQGDIRRPIVHLKPLEVYISVGLGQDDGDVRNFIRSELLRARDVQELESCWSDNTLDRDAESLSLRACGHFQWARVVCLMVKNRFDPQDAIRSLLQLTSSRDPQANLDILYTDALRQALPNAPHDSRLREAYVQVIGTIITAKQPLDLPALSALLELPKERVTRLLVDLGSVIILESEAQVARISHPSFFDFITDVKRCSDETFALDFIVVSQHLASQCLKLALRALKRDICDLRDPDLNNVDVSSQVIARCIPKELEYSCRFALIHANEASLANTGILQLLDEFLNKKLLEWIEVMSLLGSLDGAANVVQILSSGELSHGDQSLGAMLDDTFRFISRFGSIIHESALHVYLSALPFTPQSTWLYCTYSHLYQDIPRMLQGYENTWPEYLYSIPSHGYGPISFLSFSHDSSRLLAVSIDGDIRFYSTSTGRFLSTCVGLPLRAASWQPHQLNPATYAFHPLTLAASLWLSNKITIQPLGPNPIRRKIYSSIPVTALAFDAPGDLLFTGHSDGTLGRWATSTGIQEDWHPSPHHQQVISLIPSMSMLASLSAKELHICQADDTSLSLTMSLKWGKRMAFVALSRTHWIAAVLVYDFTAMDCCIHIYSPPNVVDGPTMTLAINPLWYTITTDGKFLVSLDGQCDTVATLWDVISGTRLASSSFSSSGVTSLSSDGRFVAYMSGCNRIEVRALTFETNVPTGVSHASSPDASSVRDQSYTHVTSTSDKFFVGGCGMIDGWYCSTAKRSCAISVAPEGYRIVGLSISDDDSTFAVLLARYEIHGGLLLRVAHRDGVGWDCETPIFWEVSDLVISLDGSKVAVLTGPEASDHILVLDTQSGTKILFSAGTDSRQLLFSSDGTVLISYGSLSLSVHRLEQLSTQTFHWSARQDAPWELGRVFYPDFSQARFFPDLKKIIHLSAITALGPSTITTVWDIEDESAGLCLNVDPNPSMGDILLFNLSSGWVLDSVGNRLFRAHGASDIVPNWEGQPFHGPWRRSASRSTPTHTSSRQLGGHILFVTPLSLVWINAEPMLQSSSWSVTQSSKPRPAAPVVDWDVGPPKTISVIDISHGSTWQAKPIPPDVLERLYVVDCNGERTPWVRAQTFMHNGPMSPDPLPHDPHPGYPEPYPSPSLQPDKDTQKDVVTL